MDGEKIRAIMIVEVMGRPAEHVKDSLKTHLEQLKETKDAVIISESISDSKKIDDKDLYTCFAEIELEVKSLNKLSELVFDYMPSSIEIIRPDKVSLDIVEATNFLNDLAGRLHKYDEIAKVANIRMQQMAAQNKELQNKIKELGKK